ncbi:MAG TPA: D-2-hydroxyacid dehydrogenase family protein [Micropepsaceae bacterium]|nr:D-2-hydroxyacid dehydrogenase family protein [Micropepsaceae bacterium]
MTAIRVAVIDDWQGAARQVADWSKLEHRADVEFFHRHYGADAEQEAVRDLKNFDILLLTRERSRFSASLIDRLPKLKMMSLTGTRAPNVDQEACTRHGIVCTFTTGGHSPAPAAEMSLALLMAAARRIPSGDAAIRAGKFQEGIAPGINLEGRTLGIVGLGRIGAYMARYGQAIGMRVIAWSPNLTAEKAKAAGAERVEKDELFAEADAVTIHLVLGPRSRGLVGAAELGRMKKGAILVNTSRGPIVDEKALIAALRQGRIFAALDVYDTEPLPSDNPFRDLPNTVLTPHVGFTTVEGLGDFYTRAIGNILAFLDGHPTNVANPESIVKK